MDGDAALIVLARLTSQRLPGKALMDLGGAPMIDLTIRRLRRSNLGKKIILATTTAPEDGALVDYAHGADLEVFRGSVDDVAGRCLACARQYKLDWFVRICGDSPFIDPAVVDQVCELFDDEQPDVATNVHPRTFPVGCSAEAVSTVALQRQTVTTKDIRYLEHVTAFFYDNEEMFHVENLESGTTDYIGTSVAVDTAIDYDRTVWVYDHVSDPVTADIREIYEVSGRWGGKAR